MTPILVIVIGILLFLANVACIEMNLRRDNPLWILNGIAAVMVLTAVCSLILKS